MAKLYAWIFCSRDESVTNQQCVEEVVRITGGAFGNPDAPTCESMPLAASEWHSDGKGKAYCGVLLRLDYAEQWYAIQEYGCTIYEVTTHDPIDTGEVDEMGFPIMEQVPDTVVEIPHTLQTYQIDTSRPLMVQAMDADGNPATITVTVSIDEATGEAITEEQPVMVPNEEPYKYATVPVLDADGTDTGATQDLYMNGAGCLSTPPRKAKSSLKVWQRTLTYPEVIDELETGVTLYSTYKYTFDKNTGQTVSELIDSGVYVEPEEVV